MPSTDAAASPRQRIIILGAQSAIAEAAARIWAETDTTFVLAGRSAERLDAIAADLHARGAAAVAFTADLVEADIEDLFARMLGKLGDVDVVLLAYGDLGNQSHAEADLPTARTSISTNFTSAALWCLVAARTLATQGHGTLIVIGSVAGDRGRASNYVYGAAKCALGILVQGIAHRLAGSGARAVLIKPGFVNTPMTAAIAIKGALWAKPEAIARIICRSSSHGSGLGPIVYAPWYWRWIMLAVRLAPSGMFHHSRL